MDKIAELKAKIQEALDKAQAILDLCTAEARDFTDDERTEYDALMDSAEKMVTDKGRLERYEAMNAAQKAVPVTPLDPPATSATTLQPAQPAPATGGTKSRPKGSLFAYMAHALFKAQGNHMLAADYAERPVTRGGMDDPELAMVLRAPVNSADLQTPAYAGYLASVRHAAEEFIELLRPMSVMARFPSRRMQFGPEGKITIPRQASGVSGTYIGEKKAIPMGEAAFDTIELEPKKIAVITASSNEMLAHSSPSLMELLRDDMLQGTAATVDAQFYDGTGSAVAPAGITTFDSTPTASAGNTLAQIETDLKAMIDELLAADIPFAAPLWMMAPARKNALRFIRDGNGNAIYRDEIDSGVLMGYPILDSNTLTDSVVCLVDGNQVIVAEDLMPTIDLSDQATLHFDDDPSDVLGSPDGVAVAPQNVYNLWQTDQTAVRLRWRHDWNMRHAEAISVTTGVAW